MHIVEPQIPQLYRLTVSYHLILYKNPIVGSVGDIPECHSCSTARKFTVSAFWGATSSSHLAFYFCIVGRVPCRMMVSHQGTVGRDIFPHVIVSFVECPLFEQKCERLAFRYPFRFYEQGPDVLQCKQAECSLSLIFLAKAWRQSSR